MHVCFLWNYYPFLVVSIPCLIILRVKNVYVILTRETTLGVLQIILTRVDILFYFVVFFMELVPMWNQRFAFRVLGSLLNKTFALQEGERSDGCEQRGERRMVATIEGRVEVWTTGKCDVWYTMDIDEGRLELNLN